MRAATQETAPLLLVDDKPENLLSLEAMLEHLGQPMVRATSGEDALRRVLSTEFAVILLDVNMPEMDGYETARLIKRRPRCRHVPIIFLTAAERASVSEMYRLGAVDFLQKPISPEMLIAKVSVFIELHLRGERLRAQEVELLRQAQRQSDLERYRFSELLVGVVSHDLRSPLSAISASLQFLTRISDDPAIHQVVGLASSSARRMERMTAQLLDLTRVRMGAGIALSRRTTDLDQLVRALVEEVRTTNADREVIVVSEGAVEGYWDGDRLEQVIQNLLGNAVRYGAPNAPITIRLEGTTDAITVSVHNLGEPIPPETRKSLFELFHRGTSAERVSTDGLGLGLYIAQQIALAHEGQIRAESGADGTTFTLELPRWIGGVVRP